MRIPLLSRIFCRTIPNGVVEPAGNILSQYLSTYFYLWFPFRPQSVSSMCFCGIPLMWHAGYLTIFLGVFAFWWDAVIRSIFPAGRNVTSLRWKANHLNVRDSRKVICKHCIVTTWVVSASMDARSKYTVTCLRTAEHWKAGIKSIPMVLKRWHFNAVPFYPIFWDKFGPRVLRVLQCINGSIILILLACASYVLPKS